MFRFFECVESRFARDRREPFQKLFQGLSSFEVVEQVLDRHSRAPKDRHSAQDLGVFNNDAIHGIHTVFQYLSLATHHRCQFSAKGALTCRMNHLRIPFASPPIEFPQTCASEDSTATLDCQGSSGVPPPCSP